jgi:hypothetical protein
MLLLFTTISCPGSNESTQKEAEKEFIKGLPHNPLFYLWLLGQRNPKEDPDCGGDAIGTLFGLNNNRTKYSKLEENQELIKEDPDLFYQSAKKTLITISLIQVTQADPNILKDCSKPGSIAISYCSGVYRTLNFRDDSFQLNQVSQFEAKTNVKNFLSIGKNTNDCNTIYQIKSEVLP